MRIGRPSAGLVAITGVAVVGFFGLASLGFGSWPGLVANPWRAAGLGVIGLAALASLASGIHLGGCAGPGAREQWRLIPLALVSLALAGVPPWTDAHDRGAAGGSVVRGLGLLLLVVGAVGRVGPMFVLGHRFTWPLADQPSVPLRTTGLYRWVRHPSYGGALLGAIGWCLLFRSWVGLLLVPTLFPFFHPIILAEEAALLVEFGDAYRAYRHRTWRLIPLIY